MLLGSGMSAQRRATIADVAAASGVGVGTVSRVINGASNVRETTRRSVQKVIEQLGYRPSHLAVSLSRGTPRTVAIVVPHLTRPSAVMRLAGALAVLDEQGYDTVVCNVDTQQQRDHHLTALTGRHRADGVIVVSLRLSREQLAAFRRAAVPLVTVDVMAPGVPQTITDDLAGGRLATRHLGRSWPRLTSATTPRWCGAVRTARRTRRRSPPSCWTCRTGRRPSSRHQTPRPWACSPRLTGRASQFLINCPWSASTTSSLRCCSA